MSNLIKPSLHSLAGQDLILEFDSPRLEARLGTSFINPELAKSHLPTAIFEEMKEKSEPQMARANGPI